MSYECPLCSTDFESAACRSSCPMSRGCDMVRCPRCGYEFVESGRIADLLRPRHPERSEGSPGAVQRILRSFASLRMTGGAPPPVVDGIVRLIDLPLGGTSSVISIAAGAARLAAYGIVVGTEVRLVARKPTVVLESGSTTIAVEPEIGREIFVGVGTT